MAHAAAVSPVRAEWSPASESSAWRELRRRELPGEGWTFVEATRTDRFEAAEYLRNPTAVDKSVEMEAGVLIKRSGQSAWSSRVLPMRANCTQGRMEQKNAEGQKVASEQRVGVEWELDGKDFEIMVMRFYPRVWDICWTQYESLSH